ncbi:AraC family transcriptional regulator [Lysinibacillus sp. MHQ-1]|nr:AraC family transcriptional regulator [Lysinibacillus sp. MHQ-1]
MFIRGHRNTKKRTIVSIFLWGVGGVFQDAMQVKESYSQARKARRKPPIDNIHIRYYEDLTKHPQLQKAIQFIEEHFDEQLSISEVAKYISFSPTHFSRLFKKRNGS